MPDAQQNGRTLKQAGRWLYGDFQNMSKSRYPALPSTLCGFGGQRILCELKIPHLLPWKGPLQTAGADLCPRGSLYFLLARVEC